MASESDGRGSFDGVKLMTTMDGCLLVPLRPIMANVVTTNDRSSFHTLTSLATEFVSDLLKTNPNRKVVLIRESFGGQVAPIVALKLQAQAKRSAKTTTHKNPVQGLVMVNPATSWNETNWDQLGPALANLRFLQRDNTEGITPYTLVGGMALSALIPDSTQFNQIAELILGAQPQSLNPMEALDAMTDGFSILGNNSLIIEHRIGKWLPVGAAILTEERLASLEVPTVVIAGDDDNFLPSKSEAERLVKIIPTSKKINVPGSGHYVLDGRVNLTEAIIFSDIDPLGLKKQKKRDPILDYELPSWDAVQSIIDNRVQPLRQLTSPVFFSSDETGKRWAGLGKVPSNGPIVFVANHQFFGLDLGLIIAELLQTRGILARGLAHPIIFQNSQEQLPGQPLSPGIVRKEDSTNPFDSKLFQRFGTVMVTPRNYYRLLQSGQNALLFPGGVREVSHGKDEAYQLFWPDNTDFIRTAARFNATIIPLSAVGAADSVNILLDSEEMVNLPFGIGDRILQGSGNVTAARFNRQSNEELFVTPLAVPTIPARHYFVFGKPISTQDVHHKDKEACQTLYMDVQDELKRGLVDVLEAREKDPFKESVGRLAYEKITGKAAPSFPIEELNNKMA
eukprot:CAMPEP_0202474130 /NCGR_PEP_ID=MMETSP1360-20130828/92216_1 /ASSEMBLY_ACC=CAM_ASM_000848 /TAXON_ID=515479 /ORGANISM="Licmophora paradoxa, Strain CCMP2313" /LENGTH=622 /DNA_ID=CAMNT_0049101233 /DNA_START=496 /DNA_END=2366 /DNA_ORIENTATION=+